MNDAYITGTGTGSDPPSQAAEQEPPSRERRAWPAWTVCLPGILALVVSIYISMAAALLYTLDDCFDTCGAPSPPPGAAPLAVQEVILAVAVLALVAAGLAVRAWRRGIAYTLWTTSALAVALIPLNGL
jgi:hypothetical protein